MLRFMSMICLYTPGVMKHFSRRPIPGGNLMGGLRTVNSSKFTVKRISRNYGHTWQFVVYNNIKHYTTPPFSTKTKPNKLNIYNPFPELRERLANPPPIPKIMTNLAESTGPSHS